MVALLQACWSSFRLPGVSLLPLLLARCLHTGALCAQGKQSHGQAGWTQWQLPGARGQMYGVMTTFVCCKQAGRRPAGDPSCYMLLAACSSAWACNSIFEQHVEVRYLKKSLKASSSNERATRSSLSCKRGLVCEDEIRQIDTTSMLATVARSLKCHYTQLCITVCIAWAQNQPK